MEKNLNYNLTKCPSQCANRGSIAFYPNLEKQIIEWITDCRSQGIALNTIQIRLKAKLYAKDMNIVDFKASSNWCYRFMARHNLSIRRKTHITQKLPDDYEDKLIAFQTHIIKRQKIMNPPLSLIGNTDQTPLTFELPADSTIEKKDTSTVTIRTNGAKKNDSQLCSPACMTDGTKLPPYIVFKRKTLPKGVTFPSGAIVRTQAKGWMDDNIMCDWIDVWGNRDGEKNTVC